MVDQRMYPESCSSGYSLGIPLHGKQSGLGVYLSKASAIALGHSTDKCMGYPDD